MGQKIKIDFFQFFQFKPYFDRENFARSLESIYPDGGFSSWTHFFKIHLKMPNFHKCFNFLYSLSILILLFTIFFTSFSSLYPHLHLLVLYTLILIYSFIVILLFSPFYPTVVFVSESPKPRLWYEMRSLWQGKFYL